MTTAEAIAWEAAVIASATDWANGNTDINQMELCVIAYHYGVKLPHCAYHFIRSYGPNHLRCTGAHKTLYKLLDKLEAAIKEKEVTA